MMLMTHPGVGPVVSLAYVLTIGDWQRFGRDKQVASYLGMIPCKESRGDKRRLGHISKQGSPMRWLLVQAATIAQRYDGGWHRRYVRVAFRVPTRLPEQGARYIKILEASKNGLRVSLARSVAFS